MRGQKDAVLLGLLGFLFTTAAMLPPILADQQERAARIAAHDALIGDEAAVFGRERHARLTYLLKHADEAQFDPLARRR